MYELIQAAPRTYYIQCPAKMGLWVPDGQHAVLIDSGGDKDAGRKVQKILEAQGWELSCILNTHANADHNGGNALLQQRLHVPAYAPGIDAAITSHPILEPAFLYGGYPPPSRCGTNSSWLRRATAGLLRRRICPRASPCCPSPATSLICAASGPTTACGSWRTASPARP